MRLTEEAQIDPDAVMLDVDLPSPAVFHVRIWDADWWRPELELELEVNFEPAPSVEQVRSAVQVARDLGVRVMVAGLLEATDNEEGPALRLSLEGLAIEDADGLVRQEVAAILGDDPIEADLRFVPEREWSPVVVSWSWVSWWPAS